MKSLQSLRVSKDAVAKALARRAKQKTNQKILKLEEILFAEQLKFVSDPAPNKLAVCSRRSGKTVACAADLVHTAWNNPDVVCLYITLSRNNAKKIIWREIKKLNREYGLCGEENVSELSITFPNGSVIYLSGAKDTTEIEKFRGLALKLVYIDEAQSFREYIKDLIDDVLSPALMDHAGTLALIGTPGPVPTGYFHACAHPTAGKQSSWSCHSWTFWNNPFIIKKSKLSHQAMLDRELKRRGVTTEDPSIQREWFGKWTLDSDSLLIHYDPAVNDFETLPPLPGGQRWNYIMGVDLGYNDADAICVLAWHDSTPVTYLVEETVTAKQGITELADQIEKMQKRYDITKIMMDEGALGKKIAEEMRRQKHIPIQGADKARKMENVAFLNDALRSGRFKAKKDSRFAQDSYLVEIDRDKSKPDKIVVSSKYHSDIIDATLYGFKESPAFSWEPPKPKGPVYGSKEWADAQSTSMFEAELEGHLNEADAMREYYGE